MSFENVERSSISQDFNIQLHKLLKGDFLDYSRYSPLFLDFLHECLLFNPVNRMNALEILSHPLFKESNKTYTESQVLVTAPLTLVEKQMIQELKAKLKIQSGLSNKRLLELSIL